MTMTTSEKQLVQSFVTDLRASGRLVIFKNFEEDPDLFIVDKRIGLFAIELGWVNGADPDNPKSDSLNRKIRRLKRRHSSLAEAEIRPLLINRPKAISFDKAIKYFDSLPDSPIEDSLVEHILLGIAPEERKTFTAKRNDINIDNKEREELRFKLDKAQELIAMQIEDEHVFLSGAPGSGKTVVLVARARHLAYEHPEWRIQILCYNNTLALYLKDLVSGYPNVFVETIKSFMRRPNAHIRDNTIDALLIDEWQDFELRHAKAALRTLKTGKGGLLVVGDVNQAIYHVSPKDTWITELNPKVLELSKPYRSSRQILQLIGELDSALAIPNVDEVPLGNQDVRIIRADDAKQQAKAVAFEANRLIDSGVHPSSIGILCLSNHVMSFELFPALVEAKIDFTPLRRRKDEGWDAVDISSRELKISTIASAKGLEFEHLFLLGLDALTDPNDPSLSLVKQEESVMFNRNVLVGPSRAKDSLTIFYFRTNYVMKRIARVRDERRFNCEFSEWPDDFNLPKERKE
jgi:superfamily I DNA/RNA helicase